MFKYFSELPKLQFLHMSDNHLQTLTQDDLAGLTSLSELILARNQIKSVEAKTFLGLAQNLMKDFCL